MCKVGGNNRTGSALWSAGPSGVARQRTSAECCFESDRTSVVLSELESVESNKDMWVTICGVELAEAEGMTLLLHTSKWSVFVEANT